MQISVMFARFPFGATDHPDTTDWLVETVIKAKRDPRISNVYHDRVDDTPIPMGRNKVIEKAKKAGVDILVMIDNDMCPDIQVPGCKPFWDTTLDFMLQHNGPCMVASPYCGPPPMSNVYVFRWANWQNLRLDPDMRLEQFSREEAAQRVGIEKVAALPTGLIMIDMRTFKKMVPPYFYYEWTDQTQSKKASTEDVTMTRDASLLGIPQYCNWDAWSGHWKKIRVDKPQILSVEDIQQKYREALLRGNKRGESFMMVGEGMNSFEQALARANHKENGNVEVNASGTPGCGSAPHDSPGGLAYEHQPGQGGWPGQ